MNSIETQMNENSNELNKPSEASPLAPILDFVNPTILDQQHSYEAQSWNRPCASCHLHLYGVDHPDPPTVFDLVKLTPLPYIMRQLIRKHTSLPPNTSNSITNFG
jgi:hypothetical protein